VLQLLRVLGEHDDETSELMNDMLAQVKGFLCELDSVVVRLLQ